MLSVFSLSEALLEVGKHEALTYLFCELKLSNLFGISDLQVLLSFKQVFRLLDMFLIFENTFLYSNRY